MAATTPFIKLWQHMPPVTTFADDSNIRFLFKEIAGDKGLRAALFFIWNVKKIHITASGSTTAHSIETVDADPPYDRVVTHSFPFNLDYTSYAATPSGVTSLVVSPDPTTDEMEMVPPIFRTPLNSQFVSSWLLTYLNLQLSYDKTSGTLNESAGLVFSTVYLGRRPSDDRYALAFGGLSGSFSASDVVGGIFYGTSISWIHQDASYVLEMGESEISATLPDLLEADGKFVLDNGTYSDENGDPQPGVGTAAITLDFEYWEYNP